MQLESTILFFAYRIQISRIHPDGIIREIRLWLRKKCPHGFVLFVRFVFYKNTPWRVFIIVILQKDYRAVLTATENPQHFMKRRGF